MLFKFRIATTMEVDEASEDDDSVRKWDEVVGESEIEGVDEE